MVLCAPRIVIAPQGFSVVKSVTWEDVKQSSTREEWSASYEQYLVDNFTPTKVEEYSNDRELHLFEPVGLSDASNSILCIPGGGFKNSDPKRMYPTCDMLSKLGFLAACIEYTTLANTGGSDWREVVGLGVDDAGKAIQRLRRSSNSVGAYGVSAGGALGLGAAALSREKSPDFLCLVCPAVQAVTDLPGNKIPIQIQHGAKDQDVPIELVQSFASRLNQTGISCDVVVYDDATHFVDFEHWTKVHGTVVSFLNDLELCEVRIT